MMNLALEVSSLGWIGFGIAESTSGSMPGADIVTASVVGTKTTIQDRYATAKAYPMEDSCSDWILVSGQEADGKTIVELQRAINTGDKQDRPFESMNRIVISFGNTDTFSQHVWRMATAVTWWGELPKTEVPNLPYWDFVTTGYTIPNVKTTYYNAFYNLTMPNSTVHVTAFQAVFGNATRKYVHHFLVSASETEGLNAMNGGSSDGNWSMLWAWAPGISNFLLPSEAGFSFGPTGYKSIRVQIHYDNVLSESGIVDIGSGVRMFYDTNLRPNEAGVFELGDPSIRYNVPIPQGSGLTHIEYSCPSECTSRIPETMHIFADFLHMHQTGAQMWGTQWRNGTMIRETNRIDYYDFAFQQLTDVQWDILPGDRFSTHCIYQQQFDRAVTFGQGSEQEMCIQYIFYYPKNKVQYCGFYLPKGSTDVTKNSTFCGYQELAIPNPNVRDALGGDAKEFGTPQTCGTNNQGTNSQGTNSNGSNNGNNGSNKEDTGDDSASNVLFCYIALVLFFLL